MRLYKIVIVPYKGFLDKDKDAREDHYVIAADFNDAVARLNYVLYGKPNMMTWNADVKGIHLLADEVGYRLIQYFKLPQ